MPTELRMIPAGEYLMGAGADDRFATDTERPAHAVRIAAFALADFPVTNAEFAAFRPGHGEGEDPCWPAVNLTWDEAVAYCAWIGARERVGYRLATEAEWEYACRAGSTGPFAFGDALEVGQANFLFDEHGVRVGRGSRSIRGLYPANAFGLHDLHGNICEWVADAWHESHAGAPGDGRAREGDAGADRVIRGGSWDYLPRLLRSPWRDRLAPGTRRDNVGVRLAADLES